MRILLLLIVVIPSIEIGILIASGKTIGVIPTVLLIILTGVLGAYLAKKQGIAAYMKLQEQLKYGEMPGDTIVDGVCILIGAIFLLSPGFITDLMGFLLLLPVSRNFLKFPLLKIIKSWIGRQNIKIIR